MNICKHACRRVPPVRLPFTTRRWLSQSAQERVLAPVQCYISKSRDPYLNLSIEHYFLQKSPIESTILFLYINRPSIIIGRNQNPWLEVNLALLNPSATNGLTQLQGIGGPVDLVRRRSGGGTVFHDVGNVNWTVISPSDSFTRDKHAEMVVRGLRECGIDRSRVNERHDIVLDMGLTEHQVDLTDTHVTPFQDEQIRPLKVSGSAYKLTRNRALHHGTCLLSSPNLDIISSYLHSPAKPYIKARGVESVSSPVGNIGLSNDNFIFAVRKQFAKLYNGGREVVVIDVDEEYLFDETIVKGFEELKSADWTYTQTPQFSLNSSADPAITVDIDLTARNGSLTEGRLCSRNDAKVNLDLPSSIMGTKIHEVKSWAGVLEKWSQGHDGFRAPQIHQVEQWLGKMLPTTSST